MADISFSGLASGVNTNDIVTKLLALDRAPIESLSKNKEAEANRLKAFGELNTMLKDLKSSVSTMNLTSNVRTTTASLSSDTALSATSNGAAVGSYNIAVTQLAQIQKSVSAGYASTTSSIFGTGTITIGGSNITINSSNNSLSGLVAAVNGISGQTGITASIINDGSNSTPYHIVFTGKDASTSFDVTSSLVDGSGGTIAFTSVASDPVNNITTTQTAQQAKLTVDGVSVVSNTNTITTAISGVTLNLKAVSPIASTIPTTTYTPTKLDIAADTASLKTKITAFVSSYNKIMDWIASGYAKNIPAITTSTSTTDASESGGSTTTTTTTTTPTDEQYSQLLRGDATVNGIKRGLQSILTNPVQTSGSLPILGSLGISTNEDGTLNLNTSKLDSALTSNFDSVTKLLAGENSIDGVMKKFNNYLLTVTSTSSGVYAAAQTRYQTKATTFDNQISNMSAQLDKKETTLKARFTAMESLVSSLNSQSSFLTQWTNSYTAQTKSS